MTTKPAKKTATSPKKFIKPDFINNPLSILYSCRVRLTEDERKILKDAYAAKAKGDAPAAMPSIGGSSISVKTIHSTPNLDEELSMSRLIFMDLVNSRDSINLNILVKIQRILEVEVITAERLTQAFDSYINYVMTLWDED